MRYKDEQKKESIIKATIKLVNEIGFVSSSVSKIAKEANVSPATIYIYYKNKDDLLVSTYIKIKRKMGMALLKDFDDTLPLKEILLRSWENGFFYIADNPELFQFTEQFSYSPYGELVDKKEVEQYFEPIIKVLQTGIEQKVIKNVNFDVLITFIFYPVMILSNTRLCSDFEISEENIKTAFSLAWDAIKL